MSANSWKRPMPFFSRLHTPHFEGVVFTITRAAAEFRALSKSRFLRSTHLLRTSPSDMHATAR